MGTIEVILCVKNPISALLKSQLSKKLFINIINYDLPPFPKSLCSLNTMLNFYKKHNYHVKYIKKPKTF